MFCAQLSPKLLSFVVFFGGKLRSAPLQLSLGVELRVFGSDTAKDRSLTPHPCQGIKMLDQHLPDDSLHEDN